MILRDVNEALEGIEVEPSLKHIVDNSAENLRSIFEICDVRVKEFMARMDDSGDWKIFSTEYIADNLRQVLDVIAHNSQGRYGIVYRSDRQGTNDYLVTIDIRSVDGSTITFPAVFQDIFRDIVANARKYTLPGGKISASLIDDGKEISLIVSDTGRGIPADEIEKVVEFGTRGTNTSENETKGGGFGLTKAYYNCIKYGGRMWIDSEPNAGTTITIKIPRFGNK
jgi:signal transduction histidine kinase